MNFFISHKDQILQILLILSIFVFFYLFSIRPQKKKYSHQKNFLNKLKPGLKVVTVGGIHGTIIDINSNTLTIELNKQGVTMLIEKNAISVEASQKIN